MKLYKLVAGMMLFSLTLVFVGCSSNADEKVDKAAASSEYNTEFDFTTQKLDGSEIKLSDYKGKVVIVDLWDTWCPPCRMEIPHFIDLQTAYGDKGFVMVGLAFGREGQQAVEQFVKDNGVNYINGYVNQDVIAKLGQPRGIPTTYVIDQNGNIYKKYTGYTEKSVFEKDINSLLNTSI